MKKLAKINFDMTNIKQFITDTIKNTKEKLTYNKPKSYEELSEYERALEALDEAQDGYYEAYQNFKNAESDFIDVAISNLCSAETELDVAIKKVKLLYADETVKKTGTHETLVWRGVERDY